MASHAHGRRRLLLAPGGAVDVEMDLTPLPGVAHMFFEVEMSVDMKSAVCVPGRRPGVNVEAL